MILIASAIKHHRLQIRLERSLGDCASDRGRDDLLSGLEAAAKEVEDPLWRMPLWDGYDEMLKSSLADLANAADSPMAGAVTAALFLRRFVPDGVPWAHFDTFAWRATAKPGRPKGGEALGLRAAFAALDARFARRGPASARG